MIATDCPKIVYCFQENKINEFSALGVDNKLI
jgi:hypothetical protein